MSHNKQRHLSRVHPKTFKLFFGGKGAPPRSSHESRPLVKKIRKAGNGRVAWVKQFCEKITEDKVLCRLCHESLSLKPGHFGNMIRHIQRKHPEVDRQFKPFKSSDSELGNKISISLKSEQYSNMFLHMEKEDPVVDREFETSETFDCEDNEKQGDITSSSLKSGQFDNISRYIQREDSEIDKEFESSESFDGEAKKNQGYTTRIFKNLSRSAWAKQKCRKVGPRKYQCLICSLVLNMPDGMYSNLIRHISRRHPDVYEEFDELVKRQNKYEKRYMKAFENVDPLASMLDDDSDASEDAPLANSKVFVLENISEQVSSIKDSKDIADTDEKKNNFLSESDPELENKIKILCMKPVVGNRGVYARGNKSKLWNFCRPVGDPKFQFCECIFCGQRMSCSTVSNMKRHIAKKHVDIYEVIRKYLDENDLEHLIDDKLKKIVTELHLKESESAETSVEQSENVTASFRFDEIYFYMIEEEVFKCKLCQEVVQCKVDQQEVFFNHIKDKHPNEIIAYQEGDSADDGEVNLIIVP